MKRLIHILLFVSLCSLAGAETEIVNEIEWHYSVSEEEATINGVLDSSIVTGDVSIPQMLGGCPVTSIGSLSFFARSEMTAIIIPNSVRSIGYIDCHNCPNLTSIVLSNGVRTIGSFRCYDCPKLRTIVIPDSITSISDASFSGCSDELFNTNSISGARLVDGWVVGHVGSPSGSLNLSSVRGIAGGAFWGCSLMSSVTFPSHLTCIGSRAFSDCSGLVAISIPKNVTSIGDSAFSDCSGLTSISIPENVTSIGENAFLGCSGLLSISVDGNNSHFDSREGCNAIIRSSDSQLIVGCKNTTIPANVTSIGDGAFYNCAGLRTLTIPEGVTSIGASAFSGCSGLVSINIPDSVTKLGSQAFYDCPDQPFDITTIPGVRLLNGWAVGLQDDCSGAVDVFEVRGIDTSIFAYNGAITSVILPETLKCIESGMFNGCSKLESVTIPEGVTNIESSAFYHCSKLASILIPNGVKSIGAYAFENCSELLSISIPNSVTNIGSCAFQNCSKLVSITIPTNVTSISYAAFTGCSSLTAVTIPAGVPNLGRSLFKNCSALRAVTLKSNPPESWQCWFYDYNDDGTVTYTNGFSSMFWNCPGPICVELGPEVTEIGSLAFAGCSGIASITISGSVTNIGGRAFLDCSDSLSIDIDDNSEWFSIDDGILFSKDKAKIVEVLKPLPENWTIRESVETIQDGALSGHAELLSINIPPSVTNIEKYAFENCSGLSSVGLPNGMKRIPDGIFSGCSGLLSISVPEGVTSIGCQAFSGCINLQTINLPEGVAVVGQDAFKQCNNLKTLSIPGSVLTLANDLFCDCANMEEIVLPRHFQPIVGRFGIPESTTIRYADVSTLTSPVPVSHAWLERFPGLLAEHGDDYENTSNGEAANGKNTVWECYLVGIDPTDASAGFTCSIGMNGGKPSFSWNPDLGEARSYNIIGKTNLADLEWKPGPVANQRFFKVKVQPPTITYYGEF